MDIRLVANRIIIGNREQPLFSVTGDEVATVIRAGHTIAPTRMIGTLMNVKIEEPTLHEIPLGSRQELDEDDPIKEYEEYPDEPYWVIDRKNPVTLSAEEKTNVVTGLNFLLDEIYILQTTVEGILLTVDRGG